MGYLIPTVFLLASLSATCDTVSQDVANDAAKVGLVYVGTVDGAAFFTEQPTVRKNWTQARDQCIQANMQLAKITTSAQEQFLGDTLRTMPEVFGWSWCTGRIMELSLSMFSWDDGINSTVSSGLPFADGTINSKICLTFRHNNVSAVAFAAYDCSYNNGVLCQIPN